MSLGWSLFVQTVLSGKARVTTCDVPRKTCTYQKSIEDDLKVSPWQFMCERCCPSRLVLYRDIQSMHAFIILIAISTLLVRRGLYMSNNTNFIKMTDDKWTKLWLNLCEEKGQFLYFWSVLVRFLWYRKYLFTFFAKNPSSYAYRRLSPFQPDKFDQNRTKNRMIQQSPTAWSFSADDPLSGWKEKIHSIWMIS